MSPMVKSFAAIIKKDHRINGAVNNQEEYQKNTGKPHGDFFTYRGGVEVFPRHKKNVNFLET